MSLAMEVQSLRRELGSLVLQVRRKATLVDVKLVSNGIDSLIEENEVLRERLTTLEGEQVP